MAALKVKNGNKIAVLMVNGKIIKNMDSVFKFMETRTNMKEDGCKIWDMEKVRKLLKGTQWINIGKGKIWREYTGDWAKDRKTGKGT